MPIYLAGLSPGMLRLAGEVADGVVLWLCNPNYIRDVVVPTVSEGREKAGRELDGFDIVAAVPSAVTDDPGAARERLRGELVPYFNLPYYREMLERPGSTRTAGRPTSSSTCWARSGRPTRRAPRCAATRKRGDLAVRRRDQRQRLRRDARGASPEPRLASARPRGACSSLSVTRAWPLAWVDTRTRARSPFTSIPSDLDASGAAPPPPPSAAGRRTRRRRRAGVPLAVKSSSHTSAKSRSATARSSRSTVAAIALGAPEAGWGSSSPPR